MKEFNVISAVALNGVIGDSDTNSIPWYIPADLKYFRSKTKQHTVIMGSKTHESIGKALPDRRNVVITRNEDYARSLIQDRGVDECYKSFNEALMFERPNFFVIGGEHIYGEAIRAGATSLFITIVKFNAIGDVRFPIEGHRFLEDMVYTSASKKYKCVHRAAWMKENDFEFQFTEFRLTP
jgi:dihydrofolate reductase